METLFGLLKKKQVAWFFLIVAVASTIAWGWACKINYTTTFNQLNKVTPLEAAVMFTLAIQSFEFLIPTLAVLGITKALKISAEMELGLGIAWVVVIAVDFITALQYFIGAYEVRTFWSWALSAVLAGMFLVAEILFVISLVTTYVVYKMLATGKVPDWVMNPEKDVVDIPEKSPRKPLFRNIFKRSPAPPQHASPNARDVPEGTPWTTPDGSTYVAHNGRWEPQTPRMFSVPLQQI